MKKLSNSAMMKIGINFLILLSVAKVISLAIWWFLPNAGVELQVKQNYKPAYQRVDFKNMIDKSFVKASSKPNARSAYSINNMILKGLYGKGTSGFAIVAMKSSSSKTSVVSVGEVFSGYKLKNILKDGVVFTRSGADHILNMIKAKTLASSAVKVVPVLKELKKVSRKDINNYIENNAQLWKDIAIDAIKESGKIKGFQVKRINKNSKIASLGLQKYDLIVAANNVRLKSLKDVLDIYKDIKKLKTVQLVVLRNNVEQELIYEID